MTREMDDSPEGRILAAWNELEAALRATLPVCVVAPPTQPFELLSALRINRVIGPEEEERIMALRQARNRVAHQTADLSPAEVASYRAEVEDLVAHLRTRSQEP